MELRTTPERIVLTRIRGEVAHQLQDSGAPEDIHAFFMQHWSRLMTDIFLAKGNQDPDWQAGWDTMNALLWSLSPKRGRKETKLMLRALPGLLTRLQEGCSALSVPVPERDALFARLAMLHAAVAREGLQAEKSTATDVLDQTELGDLEATAVDLSTLPPPSHDDGAILGPAKDADATALASLSVGTRIMLRVGAADRLMLLNWVSPMGGMYLFTNEQGLDALTLTRARLVAKFREGEVKVLA
jgi:hypothetical protein